MRHPDSIQVLAAATVPTGPVILIVVGPDSTGFEIFDHNLHDTLTCEHSCKREMCTFACSASPKDYKVKDHNSGCPAV